MEPDFTRARLRNLAVALGVSLARNSYGASTLREQHRTALPMEPDFTRAGLRERQDPPVTQAASPADPAEGNACRAGAPHWSFVVRAPFCPMVLRSTPTCSISISTTSPGCIADVDPGVPVKIMSPGSSVT